jgi:hypothetical protein
VNAFGPVEEDASSQKAIKVMICIAESYAAGRIRADQLYECRNNELGELGIATAGKKEVSS